MYQSNVFTRKHESHFQTTTVNNNNLPRSLKHIQNRAEKGDVDAQYSLGDIYSNGTDVNKNYSVAAKWYRLAAEQGHAEAQNCHATLLSGLVDDMQPDYDEELFDGIRKQLIKAILML